MAISVARMVIETLEVMMMTCCQIEFPAKVAKVERRIAELIEDYCY